MSYNLLNSNCQESPFAGTVPAPGKGLKGVRAIYQLDTLFHANYGVHGDSIKYKYGYPPLVFRREYGRHRGLQKIVVDSLKTPVETSRTFPLVKLESNEFRFK